MALSKELLDILVCPRCQGELDYEKKKDGIVCQNCQLLYPVKNQIPIMIEDEAYPLQKANTVDSSIERRMAIFEITEGPHKNQIVKLPLGTCKAIGRSLDDLNKTQAFGLDYTTALDDLTQKLIINYISKTGSKKVQPSKAGAVEKIGTFNRLPDLVLEDSLISRLHAMIFHDENGAGVLDLVSKNGTYVNGEEVESKNLKEGDLVEIGKTKMSFRLKS